MPLASRVLLAVGVLSALGCGGGDGNETGIRTTDAGTVIVSTTDEKAGLKVEIQNDNLYVRLTDDRPDCARRLTGKPLPTGVPEQLSFNEATDTPYATVNLR